ncbi:MAG: glycosyltransferase family 4 protein [Candidatus Moranbacteria bacterium]|nr:glycosyltransferase family 4 protein [Candidatus Moranbacteria bacterium]
MSTIGIDARFYGSIGKGLGRYTQKLIEHLEKTDNENEYFVFLRRENFEEYVPKNPNFQKVLANFQWYSFSEQLFFPWLLNSYRLDLMHFPHFNVPILYFRKFVITIHDLILLHFPTKRASTLSPLLYAFKFMAYRWVIFSAIWRSQKIIAVSQFTKNDILSQYSIVKDKIDVTYEACENKLTNSDQNSEQVLKKYGIIKPYLLYVGNAYPHKNLEKLIEEFGNVSEKITDLNLVLVGKEDYFYGRLKKQVNDQGLTRIFFPGFVSDKDIKVVYAQAFQYVFPSLYEGFGLPPLEAMAEGVPVVCANATCLPEILGTSALFFEARKEGAMAEAILKVVDDENLREELIAKGFAHVKKYSWEKMARETLEIYRKVKEMKS